MAKITSTATETIIGAGSNDSALTINQSGAVTANINGTVGATTPAAGSFTTVTTNAISFPTVQVSSANANTLDDYEEGTWTPTLSSAGASFTYPRGQYGSYCKIGGLVYAQLYIGADASGTTSGSCKIAGLPFVSANIGALAQSSMAAWASTTTPLGFTQDPNATSITIWVQNSTAAVATTAQVAGGYLVGHCTYRAA